MTDIWKNWNALRHEWSEGSVAQGFIINKMERVVEEAIRQLAERDARIRELEAQAALDAAVVLEADEYLTAERCAYDIDRNDSILGTDKMARRARVEAARKTLSASLDAALAAREAQS